MASADDAELNGDALAALRIIEGVPLDPSGRPFWRPERVRRLRQLAELGPTVPEWALCRWFQAMALQHLSPESFRRTTEAFRIASLARGGMDMLPGVDARDAQCRVIDHDWLYRQAHLYELGGLSAFVHDVAPDTSIATAPVIHRWLQAPMGGYRFVSQSPRTLVWEDMATGASVSVLNLGAAALMEEGECAIGRVVPLDVCGEMFEAAPLLVPEEVAKAVADQPDAWLESLIEGLRRHGAVPTTASAMPGGSEIVVSGLHDFGLLTDAAWALVGTFAADFDLLMERTVAREATASLGDDRRAVGVKVCLLGRTLALRAPELAPPALWPAVNAALTEPGVLQALVPVMRPDYDEHWLALARFLVEPAADLLLELAGPGWGVA